jgi:4-amino-4-deoxy-L-arabinose transferase-like glycosyltransferase
MPTAPPGTAEGRDIGRRTAVLVMSAIMAGTFVSRLLVGLHTGLDADEATTGVTALGIIHGHFALMESDAHYLGALEAYVLAPFVWLLGPTLAAIRISTALMGCVYALALYDLGRTILHRRAAALVLAGVGAVFPLFELTWTVKACIGYTAMVVLAVIALALAARIGWGQGGNRRRNWLLLGLVVGVGMWNDALIAVVFIPVLLGLLCRAPVLGWARTLRHVPWATGSALVGFSPWIVYNAANNLRSIHGLPNYSTSIAHAAKGLVGQELPIFVGTSSECGNTTVTPWVACIGLAALVGAVVWLRRRSLARLLHGHLSTLEPADMVLALAPIAVVAVTVGRWNDVPCEPRYLLPLAIPLAVGAALVLLVRSRWRLLSVLLAIGYLVIASISGYGPTVDSVSGTTTGALIPPDQTRIVAALEADHVTVLFADYWVARPILYLSDERIDAAVYNGPTAFPSIQDQAIASAHPDWLFVDGDPEIAVFRALMASRGVAATEVSLQGYELFDHLSSPLRPGDLSTTSG